MSRHWWPLRDQVALMAVLSEKNPHKTISNAFLTEIRVGSETLKTEIVSALRFKTLKSFILMSGPIQTRLPEWKYSSLNEKLQG